MRKFLAGVLLAGAVLALLPPKCQAVPIDVPYQIAVDTMNTGSVTISTTNFPSGNSTYNNNVAQSRWCLSHLVVSAPGGPSTVSVAWSTTTLTLGTTDFQVVTSTGAPYDTQWGYRTPYCAPVGQAILKITSSVSSAVISVEAFLFGGW